MIEYHRNNEIDRVQWDNCIKSSGSAKPYGYSWYLDIMAPGWEALVDDDYDSVFPIPAFSKLGFRYVRTPAFIQQLGAYSPDKPASEAIGEFLEFMPDIYRRIDLCVGQNLNGGHFRVTELTNYELDLSKPYEKLWENFSSHTKKNIESSARKKPEILNNVSPDEIVDTVFLENLRKINRINMRDYHRLKLLMNFCLKNKKGKVLGVRTARKKLIFALFLIETPGNRTIGFMLETPESVTRKINYLVINELIKTYASSKATLDLAGAGAHLTEPPSLSFGCAKTHYYRICRNRLMWPFMKIM